MAKQHTRDLMTSKVTTATIRTEYKGELDEGIEMAFYSVGTAERRTALLAKLHEIDAKLTAHEKAKAPA